MDDRFLGEDVLTLHIVIHESIVSLFLNFLFLNHYS